MTTPRRVEYTGPEGWTVWMDEDGTHLRSRSGDTLEAPDVMKLITLVHEVREHHSAGAIPAPKPPTSEEVRAMYPIERQEYDAKSAAKATYRALSPHDDQPF